MNTFLGENLGQDHVPLEAVDAVVRVAAHEEAQEGGVGVQVEHLFGVVKAQFQMELSF